MSRVKLIQQTDLSEENKEFFDMVPNLLGRVPNFYKTLSHSPYLAMALLPINSTAQSEWSGTDISGRIKELIARSTKEYQELGIELAIKPNKLAMLKNRIKASASKSNLFDSYSFTKKLENIYLNLLNKN